MRKNYFFGLSSLLLLLAVWGMDPGLKAQTCTSTQSGTSCTRSGNFSQEVLPNQGCGTYTTVTQYSPGTYFRVPVLSGACYTVSTCGSPVNTQVSIFQGTATSGPFAFNDDGGPECTGNQASAVMVPSFTDYANIDVREFNCSPGGSQSITVQLRQNNNLNFTSSAADMVEGDTRTLTATPTAVATTPQTNSGDNGIFSGSGVTGTTFTAPQPAANSQTYTITYSFGYCSTTQQITVFREPSTASAGIDQIVCDSVTTLSGNTPTYGTGAWAILSGPGAVTAPTSPNSTLTGLAPGSTTVLTWTISNGPATPSVDTVSITREVEPSVPDAGLDQNVCDTFAVLGAAVPTTGNGSWTLIGGSGTVLNPNSPTSTVANLGVGTNTLRWTVTNGNCPPKTDDVVITRDDLPTPAAAGLDQSICDTATALAGNAPLVGLGSWSVVSGTGTLVSPSNPNSIVNGIPVGTTVLAWTITSGACPSSSDTMEVTRNAAPALPAVSGMTTICEGGSAALTATSSASGPTYLWWDAAVGGNTLSSNGTFNTGPLNTTTTYFLQVTDGGTGCSSDRAPITVTVIPAPVINLGPDQTICANEQTCLSAGPNQVAYIWSNNSQDSVNCVSDAGDYWVWVTDTNGCQGTDTVTIDTFPLAGIDIGPADTAFCAGSSIMIGTPADPNISYIWSTGDMTSSINIDSSGTFVLSAVDSNLCIVTDTLVATRLDVPVANFSVDTSNCPLIVFTDNSTDATSWTWDFGDGGAGSNQQNPVYDYTNAGNGSFSVELTVDNICGTNSTTVSVGVECIVGLEPLLSDVAVSLYPNPSTGIFRVEFFDLIQDAELEVYDLAGRKVWNTHIEAPNGSHVATVDLRNEATGMYLVRMLIGNYAIQKRVVIE